MYFREFRKVVQDYCREFDIPFPSRRVYQELNREYNAIGFGLGFENDDSVAFFLDIVDWDKYMDLDKLNCISTDFSFAPLPKAVPSGFVFATKTWCQKQEGNKPMRNYTDSCAVATVTSTKSDTATQRDYFLQRLKEIKHEKTGSFSNLFNLLVDNTPKSYSDLIAAIKNGKYTIDPKVEKRLEAAQTDSDEYLHWYYGPLYGIVFEGPQPDTKGYEQALTDVSKQYSSAKDDVMSGDGAAMKAALEAFEAWTPTPAATSN